MSDIKLFHLDKAGVVEIEDKSVALEKSLQSLIEANLEPLLGSGSRSASTAPA